jgi:hypothetical protein
MDEPMATRTLPSFVRAIADAYGDRSALIAEDDAVTTYRELGERSAVLARGLMARSVSKGIGSGCSSATAPNGSSCGRRSPGWGGTRAAEHVLQTARALAVIRHATSKASSRSAGTATRISCIISAPRFPSWSRRVAGASADGRAVPAMDRLRR